jgi:hypothetical protein
LINSKNKEIEENIKLALYGASCTQEYAEEQTKTLMKIIKKKNIKTKNTALDNWFFLNSILGAGLLFFKNPHHILETIIYFGVGVTIGNVWYQYITVLMRHYNLKWKK